MVHELAQLLVFDSGGRATPERGVEMAVFVLVHPAWLGGWCWKKLVPLLEEHAHSVHTPTLTGLGERFHLAHPGVDLPPQPLDADRRSVGRFSLGRSLVARGPARRAPV